MQAVVKIGKSQFLVSPGQEVLVEKLSQTEGQFAIDQVLLVIADDSTLVGQPFVANYRVLAKILGTQKGDKVRAAVYKAKSRHRRVTGARPQFTRLLVEDIQSAATKSPS